MLKLRLEELERCRKYFLMGLDGQYLEITQNEAKDLMIKFLRLNIDIYGTHLYINS